jgi:dTMP kinase
LSWPPQIPIRTVDATQPLDAVARDIRATIAQWMAEQAA